MGPKILLKDTVVQDQTEFPLISPDSDTNKNNLDPLRANQTFIRKCRDSKASEYVSYKCFTPILVLRKVLFMEMTGTQCSLSNHTAASYGGRN